MWKLSKTNAWSNLGVTLQCKLSWSKHVDATVAKMGKSLSIIKRCSSFLLKARGQYLEVRMTDEPKVTCLLLIRPGG
jgi:hypothetical protein